MMMIFGTLVSNDDISWHFCQFFKILIFQVVRGVKEHKMVQDDKNSVRHARYLRNHTSYDCHLWYTCVK